MVSNDFTFTFACLFHFLLIFNIYYYVKNNNKFKSSSFSYIALLKIFSIRYWVIYLFETSDLLVVISTTD